MTRGGDESVGARIKLVRKVSPPYRCKYWPKGCKFTSTKWRKVKGHEKNCKFGDPRLMI